MSATIVARLACPPELFQWLVLSSSSSAHALLKKPSIILPDEATSTLDSETEQYIQNRLIQGDDLKQGRAMGNWVGWREESEIHEVQVRLAWLTFWPL